MEDLQKDAVRPDSDKPERVYLRSSAANLWL